MTYTDHLETQRLITRFITQGDVTAWMEYCNDSVATSFTSFPHKNTPSEMAQYWIDLCLKRYSENRLGLQALIDKETGAFIGQCGLLRQEVNGRSEIEVGYHLIRRHWGKGYATEAAQMFRDYGFENNVADSLVSIIHPQNVQSKAVALRNGMKLVETNAIFRGGEYNLFRITREEWSAIPQAQYP
jgi:RimJ/RimL family protein N-acetyltransferase